MRGPLGLLAALTSDGNDDQNRPAANVGAAFLIAAVVIALVGFKWLGGNDEPKDAIADGWSLGASSPSASGATTIPPTPAAIAIRLGVETTSASEAGHGTNTPTTRPGTTRPTRPGSASGTGSTGTGSSDTTGGTGPGGSSPTTHTTNTITSSTPPDDTTTTSEDTTTTSEETTTTDTVVVPGPEALTGPDDSGLLYDLGEVIGSLFG